MQSSDPDARAASTPTGKPPVHARGTGKRLPRTKSYGFSRAIAHEPVSVSYVRLPDTSSGHSASAEKKMLGGSSVPLILPSIRFSQHEGYGRCCNVSRDGKTALSVGAEDVAVLWEVGTGKVLRRLGDKTMHAMLGAVLSAGANFAATVHLDERVRLWDLSSREDPWIIAGYGTPFTCEVSADEKTVVLTCKERGMGKPGRLVVLDIESQTEVCSWERTCRLVGRCILSDDGDRAMFSYMSAGTSYSWKVELLDTRSGEVLRLFKIPREEGIPYFSFNSRGNRACIARGSYAALVSDKDSMPDFKVKTSALGPRTFNLCKMSADGTKLLLGSARDSPALFDIGSSCTGVLVAGIEAGSERRHADYAISGDGHTVLVCGLNDTVNVYDTSAFLKSVCARKQGMP